MRKKQTFHAVAYRRNKLIYSIGQCHEGKKAEAGVGEITLDFYIDTPTQF